MTCTGVRQCMMLSTCNPGQWLRREAQDAQHGPLAACAKPLASGSRRSGKLQKPWLASSAVPASACQLFLLSLSYSPSQAAAAPAAPLKPDSRRTFRPPFSCFLSSSFFASAASFLTLGYRLRFSPRLTHWLCKRPPQCGAGLASRARAPSSSACQTIWLIDFNIRLWSAISWLCVTTKR